MTVFGNDPWWIVLIKVVFVFVFLLVITIFNVWYERRLVDCPVRRPAGAA
jgi:NADH-quinone oxidoreductase subunit H